MRISQKRGTAPQDTPKGSANSSFPSTPKGRTQQQPQLLLSQPQLLPQPLLQTGILQPPLQNRSSRMMIHQQLLPQPKKPELQFMMNTSEI